MSDAPEKATGAELRQELRDEVARWLDEHWDPDLSVDEWWRHRRAGGLDRAALRARAGRARPPAARAGDGAFHVRGARRAPSARRPRIAPGRADDPHARHARPDRAARPADPRRPDRAGASSSASPTPAPTSPGLKTRAVRDGDHWVITGQKVWSSDAMGADYGMLLARTDFGVPKHAGISWFAFSLDQPGVEVRPLREMTGEALFNEVFIDGAVCDDANLIGGAGNGWAVTQTTLHFERTGNRRRRRARRLSRAAGPKGGMLGRTAGDAARDEEPGGVKTLGLPELIELARKTGRDVRPARAPEARRARDPGGGRALERAARQGRGGEGRWPVRREHREARADEDHEAVVGDRRRHPRRARAPRRHPTAPDEGGFTAAFLFAPASSIYGGTDQIQRNIAGERSLGLPASCCPTRVSRSRRSCGRLRPAPDENRADCPRARPRIFLRARLRANRGGQISLPIRAAK